MDSLAVSYAAELTRWGIETSIVVPGAFTKGTNHFAHSGSPADRRAPPNTTTVPTRACRSGAAGPGGPGTSDADAGSVAVAIVDVVNMPFGTRPSASMSIRRRTVPRSSMALPTASGPKCSAAIIGLDRKLGLAPAKTKPAHPQAAE
jgi:hypothetical protein